MLVWKSNRCPRCRGFMFIEEDLDGWYAKCLQCGHEKRLKDSKHANRVNDRYYTGKRNNRCLDEE